MRKRGMRVAGILLAVMIGAWATTATGAPADRSYGAANLFVLELDGVPAGILTGFEGGFPYGEVVELPVGQDRIVRKQIGALKYEEITIAAPFDMEKKFFQWIQETIAGKAQPKNGAIVTYDYQSKAETRMEFIGAFISEISLPKMDLAVRTPVFMTVKFRPQFTRFVAPQTGNKANISKTKIAMLSPNFRLRIDGLEPATSHASSVDAVTIKVEIGQNTAGDSRTQAVVPGRIRVSNVAVTTRNAVPFYQWADLFLLRGDRTKVKNGTLEYMDMTRTKTMLTVTFRNLGVVKIAPAPPTAAGAAARSAPSSAGEVKAEMYCEEIFLAY